MKGYEFFCCTIFYNLSYKKQLKINNQQHHSVSWEDELIKKTDYKKDQSNAD